MGLHSLYTRAKRGLGMALLNVGGRLAGNGYAQNSEGIRWIDMDVQTRYELSYTYYRSNNLYDLLNEVARQMRLKGYEAKPLKNPVNRIVEFHGTHLWPGRLPDAMPLTKTFAYQEELEQIWIWSNWSSQKQVAARRFACFGDLFIKVATKSVIDEEAYNSAFQALANNPDATEEAFQALSENPPTKVTQVYLQTLDPRHVTDFTKDHRGYFQTIRIDTPVEDEDGGTQWHTEFWDKFSYRIYVHNKGREEPEEKLEQYLESTVYLEEISPGMNFIPITHAKFLDDGSDRGWPAFWATVEKIDELNRHTTRLGSLLFRHNKALWAALANSTAAGGRLPAPSFADPDTGEVDTWNDGDIVRLPGQSDIKALAPDIDYKAAMDYVASIFDEVKQDCPELIYNDLQTQANVAYETVLKWLAPALDRASEARENAETALIAAQQMALTIGRGVGLFETIPENAYEQGLLEHTFAERPLLVQTSGDLALTVEAWKKAGVSTTTAMRLAGFTKDEITQANKEADEESRRSAASLTASLLATRDRFEVGDQPGQPRDPDQAA